MFADSFSRLVQRIPARVRPVVVTVILGLAAGLAAVLFHLAIHFIYLHGIEELTHRSRTTFLVGSFLIVAGTSAASGWLLTRFCPDAAGSGIPQLKLAFWRDFGYVPWRVVWVKFIGGALSVGGGSSLGREGPTVQLAGGLTSHLSGYLGSAKNERRAAAAAGAAAGLAAAFNTPIAAVTFVLEEILGDLNSRMLGGVLLAAVLGALVAHGMLGAQPAFTLHGQGSPGWLAFALTPFVAALAAIAGGWFQKLSLGLRAFNKQPQMLPPWVRTMLGGIAVWVIGSAVFVGTGHVGVFSLGYDDLSLALDGKLLWPIAALLLGAKLLATVACYGLGGCGGIFAPTLFFGGMAGAALAGLAGLVLPLSGADHVTLAVVGMCACLGAVVRAPVTGILIVFEMTHEFALVPVLMIGALVSQIISRRMDRENFYEAVLAQDGQHVERLVPPRSLRNWMELPSARIANFTPFVITDLASGALRDFLDSHAHHRFPVVVDGLLTGVLTRQEAMVSLSTARAPVLEPAVTCTPATPVREVATKIVDSPSGLIILVGKNGGVNAVVTMHDILRAQMNFANNQQD
ncbi:MAG: chloride channel protein [Lacunisphaera sp.]|nr:chloride channel protein [Lacunisphaera sp.]MDB6165574.1 chloride channel protein [Lacunisphaera sp.]